MKSRHWGGVGFAGYLGIPFRRETEERIKFEKEKKKKHRYRQHSPKLFWLSIFELISVSSLRD